MPLVGIAADGVAREWRREGLQAMRPDVPAGVAEPGRGHRPGELGPGHVVIRNQVLAKVDLLSGLAIEHGDRRHLGAASPDGRYRDQLEAGPRALPEPLGTVDQCPSPGDYQGLGGGRQRLQGIEEGEFELGGDARPNGRRGVQPDPSQVRRPEVGQVPAAAPLLMRLQS